LVLAPDEAGNWVEFSDQTTIEAACFWENAQWFCQVSNMPFLVSPLLEDVSLFGIGASADEILQGIYVAPVGMDSWASCLILHLRLRQGVAVENQVPAVITTEQHIKGWRKAHERTSAGPSGLHFGHFIAGSCHPLIADFEACMSHIPYATGYSPECWRCGINVELVKKPGNFRVSDMRMIILYEADFNQNNKLLGKK